MVKLFLRLIQNVTPLNKWKNFRPLWFAGKPRYSSGLFRFRRALCCLSGARLRWGPNLNDVSKKSIFIWFPVYFTQISADFAPHFDTSSNSADVIYVGSLPIATFTSLTASTMALLAVLTPLWERQECRDHGVICDLPDRIMANVMSSVRWHILGVAMGRKIILALLLGCFGCAIQVHVLWFNFVRQANWYNIRVWETYSVSITV